MSGPARVWRDLPLWYLWISTLGLLNLERNQLGAPLAPALLACAPAFAAVTLLFVAQRRLRGESLLPYGVASALLLAAILAGPGPRLTAAQLLLVFEWSALAGFALLAVHAWRQVGRAVFLLVFGVGLLYGTILENAGVAMGFFSEGGYLFYLPGLPAPLATAVGWCQVFYPLWWVTRPLNGWGAGPRAVLATGLALLLDLQLDPVATASGFWVWHPSLPPAVRGVPWINFCAWVAAVLPFAWAAFEAETRGGAGWLLRRLPLVLMAAGILVLALSGTAEWRVGWPSLDLFRGALGILARP